MCLPLRILMPMSCECFGLWESWPRKTGQLWVQLRVTAELSAGVSRCCLQNRMQKGGDMKKTNKWLRQISERVLLFRSSAISESLFLVLLLFSIFFLGFTQIASADPYNINLVSSSCLSTDITTGPIGWYCQTPSNFFIVTFFGVNRGAMGLNLITVEKGANCDSFIIKEEGASYTNFQVIDSKHFTAAKSITGQPSVEIKCGHIAPPHKPAEPYLTTKTN